MLYWWSTHLLGFLFAYNVEHTNCQSTTFIDHKSSISSKLDDYLATRHSKKIRPVSSPNDTLIVHVLASLYQIVEVEQKSNLVAISAYFDLSWMDEYLSWSPSDFNGTLETYLSAHEIWIPDLYMYHSVQGSTPLFVHQAAVQLNYKGLIRILVPFTAKALCTINVKYFPFDSQSCFFQFGSWSHKETHVKYNVKSKEVNLDNFYDNQEWYLVEANLTENRSTGLSNETYSTVTLAITIKRGPFYYVFNLIIPTTLVTIVSVIGFHAPANSTERRESKFRLGIMTLLSMGVLLLNVVDDMPKFSLVSQVGNRGSFSDAPLLGLYYLSLIFVVSFSSTTTALFVTLESYALRHPSQVPRVLDFLAFEWPWQIANENNMLKIASKQTPSATNNVISLRNASGCAYFSVENTKTEGRREPSQCREKEDTTDRAIKSSISKAEKISSKRTRRSSIVELSELDDKERLGTGETGAHNLIELCEICSSILDEIRKIQRLATSQMNSGKVVVLENKSAHSTRVPLLSKKWDIIIGRIEIISLCFYLVTIFICLMLFFYPSWY